MDEGAAGKPVVVVTAGGPRVRVATDEVADGGRGTGPTLDEGAVGGAIPPAPQTASRNSGAVKNEYKLLTFAAVHAPGLTQVRSQLVVIPAREQKQVFSCGVNWAGRLSVRMISEVQLGATAAPEMEEHWRQAGVTGSVCADTTDMGMLIAARTMANTDATVVEKYILRRLYLVRVRIRCAELSRMRSRMLLEVRLRRLLRGKRKGQRVLFILNFQD